jgi:hypothetical protein
LACLTHTSTVTVVHHIKFNEYELLPETLSATWANCDHDANYLDAYHPVTHWNYWLLHIRLLLGVSSQMKAPPFLILKVNKYYSRIPKGRHRL